ncbi:MAG TPA: YdeI/OmpD-associated family protein [Actinomycetota bacterium]|nr:YdeI/OmpD-associated family protein [Actinomycetota bacterium]
MEIGKTRYFLNRDEWRAWLAKNHDKASELWLITYKKHTGKKSLPYNDAVEEALCYGWIDSIVKRLDDDRTVQRYSPRRPKSNLSETNKERIRRLIDNKRMTKVGLAKVRHLMDEPFEVPSDILAAIKKDKEAWRHYQSFPESYKRVRIGWIEGARNRPEVFRTRLSYFIRMTAKNSKYGMVR